MCLTDVCFCHAEASSVGNQRQNDKGMFLRTYIPPDSSFDTANYLCSIISRAKHAQAKQILPNYERLGSLKRAFLAFPDADLALMQSTHKDRVFVYFADHGAPGMRSF